MYTTTSRGITGVYGEGTFRRLVELNTEHIVELSVMLSNVERARMGNNRPDHLLQLLLRVFSAELIIQPAVSRLKRLCE